jgi:3',5'-cyclic AMP phosphodiesterase CpdA
MNSERQGSGSQETPSQADNWVVTRRDFLTASGLVAAGLFVGAPLARAEGADRKAIARFGIVTDSHYADVPGGGRWYRGSIAKMTECVALMNDKKVDFLIELGDFKDQDSPPLEKNTLKHLETIEAVFGKFKGPRYHVMGNHDVDSISKEQFLSRVTNTGIDKGASYYSFDAKGLRCVVLDANYRADGSDYDRGNFNWTDASLPGKQLDWLKKDLASASKPVIAFVHQQLDGAGSHYVKNASDVRQILQEGKKVLAVFQGHNHRGHYSHVEGIHYYTLIAMVDGTGEENNSYAIVEVYEDGSIAVTGYRRAVSRKMERKS